MNATAPNDKALVRVALVQMSCEANQQANLRRAIEKIAEAASQGAKLICLQELFVGHYPCQSENHDRFDDAEPIPGPTSNALAQAAAKYQVVIVGSIFERRTEGLYHNTATVYEKDGSLLGLYRKMHIPDDPLYYEKFYFTPGDLGFRSFETSIGKIGVCVCWDQWFPEAARLTALCGAKILLYPTAIGWEASEKGALGESQHSAWETVMRSHAITNGIFVGAANRIGVEHSLEFWGGSFMSDPQGNVISKASHDLEELLYADCDLSMIDQTRRTWPFLRDRRIDAYQKITRLYVDEPPTSHSTDFYSDF